MAASWKSKGHYLRDGTEWKGYQHARRNGIYTLKKAGKTSKKLYHYKELSAKARKKVKL